MTKDGINKYNSVFHTKTAGNKSLLLKQTVEAIIVCQN